MDRIFSLFKKIEKDSPTSGPVDFMLVGLGNYGEKYKYTRHNAGFLAMSYISQKLGIEINRFNFKALTAKHPLSTKNALFVLPQTYMNNSGEAVRAAMDYYKLDISQILVIYDDISLPCGKLRIRKNGSAGGHNGIKSIIEHTGSENFARIKIGVGEKPHSEMDLADWVLSTFSEQERNVLFDKFENVYKAVLLIADGKTDEAMNKYNG